MCNSLNTCFLSYYQKAGEILLSLYFIYLKSSNELVLGALWVGLWLSSFQAPFQSQGLKFLG